MCRESGSVDDSQLHHQVHLKGVFPTSALGCVAMGIILSSRSCIRQHNALVRYLGQCFKAEDLVGAGGKLNVLPDRMSELG